jgi:acetyl-CoA carboxylase biotin carboxyl carrier protein
MTIDEIKELLRIFNESGVGELELERGDYRIRISRGSSGTATVATAVPAAAPVMSHAPVAVPVVSAPVPNAPPAPPAAASVESEHSLVKSPIVGTYYDQPSPSSPPFVKVGDSVEPGQVLCIIESMKLMNEIEAEIAGTVMAKLVEHAKPVEYGEPLFAIKPR